MAMKQKADIEYSAAVKILLSHQVKQVVMYNIVVSKALYFADFMHNQTILQDAIC